jgi:hypothetical protein
MIFPSSSNSSYSSSCGNWNSHRATLLGSISWDVTTSSKMLQWQSWHLQEPWIAPPRWWQAFRWIPLQVQHTCIHFGQILWQWRQQGLVVSVEYITIDVTWALTDEEGLEETRVDDMRVLRLPHALCLPDAESEVAAHERKQTERYDLADQTCQHDILPQVGWADCVGCRCNSASQCL